jgi:peroxiredoxin Q/BCP
MEQYDAVIVGVSTDSAESHQAFKEKYGLPFPLIPDPQKRIVSLYQANGFLGFITARITYVIDKESVIRAAFQHDFAVGRHLPQALDALRSIHSVPAQ